MSRVMSRARPYGRALPLLLVCAMSLGAARGPVETAAAPRSSGADSTRSLDEFDASLADTLFGLSGKLRVRLLGERTGAFVLPIVSRLFGDSATKVPGVYDVPGDLAGRPFSVITLVPFATKNQGRIGSYRIGSWPAERRRTIAAAYANPDGFIVVTPDNQDLRVSEHFRLRDFLTKDQHNVWPKYLVLRLELVDKLELIIDELKSRDIDVERMVVMSGFRTPQYNAGGGDPRGRAQLSRHLYGDAADVFIDNDGNGRMDDLTGDGRIDQRDLRVLLAAVEAVERRHPSLVGGLGEYRANRSHGPFAHVDVRGNRARWGS